MSEESLMALRKPQSLQFRVEEVDVVPIRQGINVLSKTFLSVDCQMLMQISL